MLPKNRLLEADFSGLRRFHHEMMESILMVSLGIWIDFLKEFLTVNELSEKSSWPERVILWSYQYLVWSLYCQLRRLGIVVILHTKFEIANYPRSIDRSQTRRVRNHQKTLNYLQKTADFREDIDPNLIQYYRTHQKKGLIGHRSKMIAHLKTLWPALVQLTFSNKTLILDECI